MKILTGLFLIILIVSLVSVLAVEDDNNKRKRKQLSRHGKSSKHRRHHQHSRRRHHRRRRSSSSGGGTEENEWEADDEDSGVGYGREDWDDGGAHLGGATVHKTCRKSGMVALTFDDGVVAETSQILDILAKHGVSATFFIVGHTIESNPMYHKVLKRIIDNGHTLGTHTYSHADLTSLGADGVKYELETAGDLIEQASGARPKILRPPYGYVGNEMLRISSKLGYTVVNWNLDTNDWRTPYDTTPMINSIYENDHGKESKIVLMHDRPVTVKALDTIIKFYKKKGMEFVNMEKCLGASGYF